MIEADKLRLTNLGSKTLEGMSVVEGKRRKPLASL